MDLLQQGFDKPKSTALSTAVYFEFTSPRVKPNKSTKLSSTLSPWNNYTKRKEIIENPSADLRAIMAALNSDGYIRTAVAKYVNSIFLRGYKIHTLKPGIEKNLKVRLRLLVDAMPDHNHIDDFFHSIARDLVAYANVYILKVRAKAVNLPKIVGQLKGVPYLKVKAGGKTEKIPREPIAGYELINPATVHIIRDDAGNISRFEQWPMWCTNASQRPADEKYIRKWDPQEIIHVHMDREDGYPYGNPFLNTILDDIRILRTLEDNASRLAFRFAFPFTQVRVGETKVGFEASEEEINKYRDLIQNSPPDATLVTNEKVNFEVIGTQGHALDMKPYLEHFEGRVFSGLQISEVSMGRGDTANRSTADAMTTEMHDQIKNFQNIIARTISEEIFRELLLEAGYDWYVDPDKNWALMIFEEIEIESKIKIETHIIQLLQNNTINFSEARQMMGRQPFKDSEWDDTYLMRFLLPQDLVKKTGLVDLDEHAQMIKDKHESDMAIADAQVNAHKAAADAHAANADATRSGDNNTTVKDDHVVTTGGGKRTVKKSRTTSKPGPVASPRSGSRRTDSKIRPANQYGRRTGPKRSTEFLEAISARGVDIRTRTNSFTEELSALYQEMQQATLGELEQYALLSKKQDPIPSPKMVELLFTLVESRLQHLSERFLLPSFNLGVTLLEKEAQVETKPAVWNNERQALLEFNSKTMKRLIGDLERNILRLTKKEELLDNPSELLERVKGIFGIFEYRLKFIANTELPQSFWFGYASAALLYGVNLQVVANDEGDCEQCQELVEKFILRTPIAARLSLVPPCHPNCDCSLEISGS